MDAKSTQSRRDGLYRYLIFLGNNSDLVRQTLHRRPWWSSAIEDEDSKGNVCITLPSAVFGGPPRMDYGKHKVMSEDALLDNAFDFCWRPTLGMKLNSGDLATIHSIDVASTGAASRQLLNHFPSVKCIASKTGLLRSLQRYYAPLGIEVFDNVPTTFILKDIARKGASEYTRFCSHFRLLDAGDVEGAGERMPGKHCRRNMWLVKPAYLNQGKGIKVYDELTSIKEHLASVDREGLVVEGGGVGAGAEWVVQKYAEQPLLINGRKFDIRIWVLVDDCFNCYVYQDGYCRTSSELFTLDLGGKRRGRGGPDASQMVHLTNYCMQKHSKQLGAFEEGNTLSFEQLQTYIDETYGPGHVDFRGQLLPRMKELILDAILANRDSLMEGNKGRRHFELFGYDFLIDCDFRSWLIEVNTNPYIDKQNPWHHRLLLRMMEDLTALAIDPFFPPPGQNKGSGDFAPLLPPTKSADVGPLFRMAQNAKGYSPLPEECFTHAFTYALRWSTAGAGSPAHPDDADIHPDDAADPEAEEDEGDEHGVDGNAMIALTQHKASPAALSSSKRPLSESLKSSPYSAPAKQFSPRPKAFESTATAPSSSAIPSKATDAEEPPRTHYRDPRLNGWELLYSENPLVDPMSIPHQRAMSTACINKSAVELCRERGGIAHIRPEDLSKLGVRFDSADGDVDEAAQPPRSLGPFACRYIHVRDPSWLYPRGEPPSNDADADMFVDAVPAKAAELDARFQKLKAANVERRQRMIQSVSMRRAVGPKHLATDTKYHPEDSDDDDENEGKRDVRREPYRPPQRPVRLPMSPMRASAVRVAPAPKTAVEDEKPPAMKSPKVGVPTSSDIFAFVLGFKHVDRVIWSLTQLRFVLDKWLALPLIVEDASYCGRLPPQRPPTLEPAGDDSGADASAPGTLAEAACRVVQAHLTTPAEIRRVVACASRHLQASIEQEAEAGAKACVEGGLVILPAILSVCAAEEEFLQQMAMDQESNDEDNTSKTEFPAAEKCALITPRSREALIHSLRLMLVCYKRDGRLRCATPIPTLATIMHLVSPPVLCTWTAAAFFKMHQPERAEEEPSLPAGVRKSQIHSLQTTWAAAAARAPASTVLLHTGFRMLAHILCITRGTSEVDGRARDSVVASGVIPLAAAQAMIADGECRKSARDALAYVSQAEIRRCHAALEPASETASPGAIVEQVSAEKLLRSPFGCFLALHALSREISLKSPPTPLPVVAASPTAATARQAKRAGSFVDLHAKELKREHKQMAACAEPKQSIPGSVSDSEAITVYVPRHSSPRRMLKQGAKEGTSKRETRDAHQTGYCSDVSGAKQVLVRRARSSKVPSAAHSLCEDGQRRLPAIPSTGPFVATDSNLAKQRRTKPVEAGIPDAAWDQAPEKAQRTAAAFEEWQRRKAEEAKLEKMRADQDRAAAEAEKAAKERARLEKITEVKRKLVEAKQKQALRDAERMRRAMQKVKEAQMEAQMRAEMEKVRECAWIGLSSGPARTMTHLVPVGTAVNAVNYPNSYSWSGGTAKNAVLQGRDAVGYGDIEHAPLERAVTSPGGSSARQWIPLGATAPSAGTTVGMGMGMGMGPGVVGTSGSPRQRSSSTTVRERPCVSPLRVLA